MRLFYKLRIFPLEKMQTRDENDNFVSVAVVFNVRCDQDQL